MRPRGSKFTVTAAISAIRAEAKVKSWRHAEGATRAPQGNKMASSMRVSTQGWGGGSKFVNDKREQRRNGRLADLTRRKWSKKFVQRNIETR